MWRILKSTTASMANFGGYSHTERDDEGEDGGFDLSAWELVNALQSDDEDLYSFEGDDVGGEVDGVIFVESEPRPVQEDGDDGSAPESIVTVADVIPALSVSPPMTFPVEMTRSLVVCHDGDGYTEHHDVDVDDDDDVGMGYGNDELVAWELESKFGKQRVKKMGKMGKKGIHKYAKKRLPCYYKIRPGSLY